MVENFSLRAKEVGIRERRREICRSREKSNKRG
jgi:hypothetical protein